MKIIVKILLVYFFLFGTISYSQTEKSLKILKENEIKYYYVYKAIDFSSKKNDTLFFMTSKSNNTIDSKYLKLKEGLNYIVKTRLYSRVRISEDIYLFCKPGGNIYQGDTLSLNSLPILILEASEIKNKCNQ